ncbi:MAG: hypothetical protein AAFY22_08715 [Pseudomonadota bacterium]
MRIWGLTIIAMFASVAAHAAPTVVLSDDFEGPLELNIVHPFGSFNTGEIPDWTLNNLANGGIYAPEIGADPTFVLGDNDIGERVAYLNRASGLFQLTDTVIESGNSFELSVLIGNRIGLSFGGTFGIFAQDADGNTSILGQIELTDALVAEGTLDTLSLLVSAEQAMSAVGSRIGVFFNNTEATQILIDNVLLTASTAEVPLPAAAWLFGSVLAGGFVARRRKAKA